jgi:polyferredoxin
MAALVFVHVYIVFHLVSWHVFDIEIWGKTAMTGVPSLVNGNINAAAIMVLVILASIFLFGRGFCGWACHMRGVIELADWTLRKLNISGYRKLRRRNVLLNTRYRWMFRLGALFVLLLPVIVALSQVGFSPTVDLTGPPPLADLPGYENRLFGTSAPINVDIGVNVPDILLAIGAALFIQFTMSIVMNLRYVQGAFCRILCPYAPMFVPFMNISSLQRKITRTEQCCGCRSCSQACPQGIDVSREIYHFDGKVINRECIKCYNCIDACDHGVLKDTSQPAVIQNETIKGYEKRPWQKERVIKDGYVTAARNVQLYEGLGPVSDFVSIIVGLIGGGVASQLGGFWFYVGAITSFVAFRSACFAFRKLFFPVLRANA